MVLREALHRCQGLVTTALLKVLRSPHRSRSYILHVHVQSCLYIIFPLYIHTYVRIILSVCVFVCVCSAIGWMAAVVSLNEARAGPRFKVGEGVPGSCSDGQPNTQYHTQHTHNIHSYTHILY